MVRAALLGVTFMSLHFAKAEEVDWSALNLDVDLLQKMGTQHYEYKVKEPGEDAMVGLGEITIISEVSENAVVLKDRWDINYRGEKISLGMTITCRKDRYLSPLKIESKGEGSDEVANFVATVKAGKANVIMDGRKPRVMVMPEGTITTAAMMRLITLVPTTPDVIYHYKHSLETEELNLKNDYRLSVLGPETINMNAIEVKCTKFKMEGGGIKPAYYWVDEHRVLQRILLDDRKVIDLRVIE